MIFFILKVGSSLCLRIIFLWKRRLGFGRRWIGRQQRLVTAESLCKNPQGGKTLLEARQNDNNTYLITSKYSRFDQPFRVVKAVSREIAKFQKLLGGTGFMEKYPRWRFSHRFGFGGKKDISLIEIRRQKWFTNAWCNWSKIPHMRKTNSVNESQLNKHALWQEEWDVSDDHAFGKLSKNFETLRRFVNHSILTNEITNRNS